MKKVGFIGLGLMGGPMAANVARAGYPLTVYNRTPEKAVPLHQLGARVANNPKEVVEASDVVITMLTDARAVEAVLSGESGMLAGARSGKVLIDMSTVAPQDSRRIAQQVNVRGIQMLDAPVIGSTGPAASGTLGIMVGGEKGVFEAQRDLLGTMGKDLYYMGPQGCGAQMKLCMNLLVAAQLVSLAEALVMATKAGLDKGQAGQIIASSVLASNLIIRKVPNIVNNDYAPAFSLKHMQKDMGLILRTADDVGVALPASSVIHQLFTAAKVSGYAEEDSSAIFCLLAEMAGIELS